MLARRTVRSVWHRRGLEDGKKKANQGGALFLEGSCRIFVSDIWSGLGKGKQNGETKFKRYNQEIWTRVGEEERWEKVRTNTGRVSITEDWDRALGF